jgi:hypothetical protein
MSGMNRRISTLSVLTALLMSAGPASALFIGPYDVSNWAAIENYDATVDVSGAPSTIVLTGAADQGTTVGGASDDLDFTISAVVDTTLQFDWTYTSNDADNWDWGSFLLDGAETVLANNAAEPAGGTYSTALLAGQVFGFRVHSVDRAYSPGVLTITNFTVMPEPGTGVLVLAGLIGMTRMGATRRIHVTA